MSESFNVLSPPKPTPIVLIESIWNDFSGFGTGFFIGENNDVITATHVIYSQKYGLADRIKVYPSYDSNLKGLYAHYPVEVSYFDNIDPDGDNIISAGDFRYETQVGAETDIALLTMDVNLVNQLGSFPVDWDFKLGHITIKGYSKGNQKELDTMQGYATKDSVDNLLIVSNLSLKNGNSGSPVISKNSPEGFVIGVVSTTGWMTSLNGHRDWLENAIVENDVHLKSTDANFKIFSSKTSVKEGSEVQFIIQTNLAEGSKIRYTIYGLDSADVEDINEEGFINSDQNGKGILNIKILADEKTEGNEVLTLKIGQSSFDVSVIDSSINYMDQIIFRLYLAVFSRKLKLEEVSFYRELYSNDEYVINNIANNFIESLEFKTQYGENLRDDAYINALYQNVVGRKSNIEEVAYYQEKFDNGIWDRPQVMINFAESPENMTLVGSAIADGIWLPDM